MAFQNTVNRVNTYGMPGEKANGQVPHYTPTTPRVATGATVNCGDFVWIDDQNGVSTCSKAGTGKPTGIVELIKDFPLASTAEASLQIPEGRTASVIAWGDVFVKVANSAAVGQKLFVNNTTGEIKAGAAGGSVASSTETDWAIVSLANNAPSATGSVVIASNVGANISYTMAS